MSDSTYKNAAQRAAVRWKEKPTDELKEQIMDSFRLCKRIQERIATGHYAPVKQAWIDAFRAAGCLEGFDFMDESQI